MCESKTFTVIKSIKRWYITKYFSWKDRKKSITVHNTWIWIDYFHNDKVWQMRFQSPVKILIYVKYFSSFLLFVTFPFSQFPQNLLSNSILIITFLIHVERAFSHWKFYNPVKWGINHLTIQHLNIKLCELVTMLQLTLSTAAFSKDVNCWGGKIISWNYDKILNF